MKGIPHRNPWPLGALLAGVILCGTASVRSEEPREDTPIAPAVPEALAERGTVYYVVATKTPQIRFSSKAKLEKFDGTSKELGGFVVVATETEGLPIEFAAAEFRLPVVSLITKSESRTEHIQGKPWLNAATYPEIVFAVTGVSKAKLVREREGKSIYKATLNGTITLMGLSQELAVATTITMKSESEKTRRIAPGDLLTIKGTFSVTLADFGIKNPAIQDGKVAEKIKITTNVTLSTRPPGS